MPINNCCCSGGGTSSHHYFASSPCTGGSTVYIPESDAPDASKVYLIGDFCQKFPSASFARSTPPAPLVSLAGAPLFEDCTPCLNNTSPCITCTSPSFIIQATGTSGIGTSWVIVAGLATVTAGSAHDIFFPIQPTCPTGPSDTNPKRLRRELDGRWYFRFDGVGGLVEVGTTTGSFPVPPLGAGTESDWVITANTTSAMYTIVEAACCFETACEDLPLVVGVTLPDGSPVWDSLIPNPTFLYPDTDYPIWDGLYYAVDGDPCNGYESWLDGGFKRVQVSGGYILSAAFGLELIIGTQWPTSVYGACDTHPLGLFYLGTNIGAEFLAVPPVVRIE